MSFPYSSYPTIIPAPTSIIPRSSGSSDSSRSLASTVAVLAFDPDVNEVRDAAPLGALPKILTDSWRVGNIPSTTDEPIRYTLILANDSTNPVIARVTTSAMRIHETDIGRPQAISAIDYETVLEPYGWEWHVLYTNGRPILDIFYRTEQSNNYPWDGRACIAPSVYSRPERLLWSYPPPPPPPL